jgi:hypothetical protein
MWSLVLLLCSSCFFLGRWWGVKQHCGGPTEPVTSFDGARVVVIQIKLEC